MLIAWAVPTRATCDDAPGAGTCNKPAGGTCTTYEAGGLTSAQLRSRLEPVCASGEWSAKPCATSALVAICRFTERTDFEDLGMTQTIHVYAGSSETAASTRQRCASAGFEGMSAPGIWTAAREDDATTSGGSDRTAPADVRDRTEGGGPNEPCSGPGDVLLAVTVAQIACEADEIQFGFRP